MQGGQILIRVGDTHLLSWSEVHSLLVCPNFTVGGMESRAARVGNSKDKGECKAPCGA